MDDKVKGQGGFIKYIFDVDGSTCESIAWLISMMSVSLKHVYICLSN